MVRITVIFFISLLTIIPSTPSAYSQEGGDKSGGKDAFQKVTFMIDFTDYEEGSVESWLRGKGFEFKRDAQNRKKLDLEVGEKGLVLDTRNSMFGVITNEGVDLEEYTSIRLEFGIIDYPEGVSYEEGVRNEALMVMVFFGYDMISSGHFLIPNTPYFIGFFLGREEKVGKGYVGRYF